MNINMPPIIKAAAYPKENKYFNQFLACLAEASLLLRDFPSSGPKTCPVHVAFPIELGTGTKSPGLAGELT